MGRVIGPVRMIRGRMSGVGNRASENDHRKDEWGRVIRPVSMVTGR